MNLDVFAVQAFDQGLVAKIKEKQAQIDEEVGKVPLRITEVRAHPVLMPWRGTKHGTSSANFTILEFQTDAGLVGLEERSGKLSEQDLRNLREKVVGKSPYDERIREDLKIAYWDLIGKVVGKPLHEYLSELFGLPRPYREKVPLSAYTWARYPGIDGKGEVNFQNYPQFCQQLVKEGHRTIKVSMIDFEPLTYIDLIHRIREAVGPDIDIRIDDHGSWGPQEALRVMKGVEDCNVEYFETPVGGELEVQWRHMTRLRMMSTIPISSHSWMPPYIWRPGLALGTATLEQELDLRMLERYDAADISAPDFSYGEVSPLAAKRIYDVARFLGMGLMMHSAYELGVKVMHRLHIASFAIAYEQVPITPTWSGPVPRQAYAIDGHYNQWVDDILAGGKMEYEEGFLTISDRPGLGVELDPEKLKQYCWTEEKAKKHAEFDQVTERRFRADIGWIHERSGWRKPAG